MFVNKVKKSVLVAAAVLLVSSVSVRAMEGETKPSFFSKESFKTQCLAIASCTGLHYAWCGLAAESKEKSLCLWFDRIVRLVGIAGLTYHVGYKGIYGYVKSKLDEQSKGKKRA